jgi:hypothetical protein
MPVQGLMLLLGLLLGGSTWAASYSGRLYTDGWGGFDWYFPSGFSKSKSTLGYSGGTLLLQSRFIWNGSGLITGGEHALVAYTQGSQTDKLNSPLQSPRQTLFRYGAGAFVSDVGLALELWSVPGGTQPDTSIAWEQVNQCGWMIAKKTSANLCIPLITLAHALSNPPDSYITSNPGFTLSKGRIYWVRITLTGEGNGWVRLKGELFDGSTLVQMGQIGFVRDQYMPLSEQLKGSIGRTPGQELIMIDAFDTF